MLYMVIENLNVWSAAWSSLRDFEVLPVRRSAEAADHIPGKL